MLKKVAIATILVYTGIQTNAFGFSKMPANMLSIFATKSINYAQCRHASKV